MQLDLRNAVGKEKSVVTPPVVDEELRAKVKGTCDWKDERSGKNTGQETRQDTLDPILDETVKHFNTPEKNMSKDIADAFLNLKRPCKKDDYRKGDTV